MHSRVDTERLGRTGDPECVYAPGKTPDEVVDVVTELRSAHPQRAVLVTRCPAATMAALAALPDAAVHERSGCVTLGPLPEPSGQVVVVSAGTSDGAVAEEAAVSARAHGTAVARINDVGVAGIHRLMAVRDQLALADCLIVVAGMEGALPSVVAGLVGSPVVAVPTSTGYGVAAGGLTALAAMLSSCAPGVVVVNIDNGYGAGVHAARVARQSAGVRAVTTGAEPATFAAPLASDEPDAQIVLEANVDDLDPRVWPGVLAALLDAGALDAWLTPILMKKGRPAHTLHALVTGDRLAPVRELIFHRTSTLGVREIPVSRTSLERRTETIHVDDQPVRVKVALFDGRVTQVQPEWADVTAAAIALDRPTRAVLAHAQAAAAHLW